MIGGGGLSCGGSGQSDGGWKDNHVMLLHFSRESFLGYFSARASFSRSGSQLEFVGGVEESRLEVVTGLVAA